MATIRKRGTKWHAQVRLKVNKSETRSFPTKVEAISWSQQLESQMRLGENPTGRTTCDLTFGEAVKRYITQVTCNKKGFREEGYRLRKLLKEAICGKRLFSISSADIATLRDERLKKVSSSSVRRELVAIKHLFNIAMFEWETGLTKNPVSKVRLPSCSPSRQRRIASKEICDLVAAHSPRSKVPFKELILFALETGMRRSEILSIRPELVDLDKAVIYLPTSKSGMPRQVPLSANAINTLKKLDCSFATTPSALGQAWRRAARKAELKDIRFHDLRHEAISRFFEAGLNLSEVMQISGHTDVKSLMRYTHPRPSEIAKKLNQVPEDLAVASILLKQLLAEAPKARQTGEQKSYPEYKEETEEKFKVLFGFSLFSSAEALIKLASQTELYPNEFAEILGVAMKLSC